MFSQAGFQVDLHRKGRGDGDRITITRGLILPRTNRFRHVYCSVRLRDVDVIESVLLLLFSLVLILGACELFINGLEWTGYKLRLNEGVVGSIFAAVGTAMPETMIPLIREVQQRSMDQPRQGYARPGKHNRRDGVSKLDGCHVGYPAN